MIVNVAIVVFDDIIPFHLSVPCAVFEKALNAEGKLAYKTIVCAPEPGELKTSAGFSIVAHHGLDALLDASIVIVPSWTNPDKLPSSLLLTALQDAHQRGTTIVGLCMGAFVLAAAGLLNGRKATTHWCWTADFIARYPQVNVDRDVLYIDDGDIVTSAGTAASIDCCLHLVRKHCGADSASSVARLLVVPPFRQGGQAQYIEQPIHSTKSGDRFTDSLNWAAENLQERITLDILAERTFLSRRSFTRRFQQTTGTNFTQWLLNQRLALAQSYLEKSDCSIERVASECGFVSALTLRRHFKKQLNTSPSLYRLEFRGKR